MPVPAARGVPDFERDVGDAVCFELGRCLRAELGNDFDAGDVSAALGEQRRHVAAAGADFQDTVAGPDGELLQHARLEPGRQHGFAMAERDLHVDESETAILRGHELFAPHRKQQIEHFLVQHFPRPDLLFDHVEPRAFDGYL